MTAKPISIMACFAIALSTGCAHNTAQPPSVADVTAQAQKARENNQKMIDGIRNNPTLSDDQKTQMIARISRGRQTQ